MMISNCLVRNARRNPRGLALSFGEVALTWSQLASRVNRAGNALIALGVTPGTTVVGVLANSVELVELQLASLAIGAVFVPVMPTAVPREIAHVVEDSGAFVIVCDAAFAPDLVAGSTATHIIAVGGPVTGALDYAELTAAASATDPGVRVTPDAVATIRYTSGTTGVPKGCVATQSQLAWAAATYLAQVPITEADRATLSSPLSAGLGIALLHVYVCAGVAIWLLPKFDPADLLETIEREGITLVYAIETTFNRLTRHPDCMTRDLGSIRLLYGNSPGKDAADGFRRLRANPSFQGSFFNAYGSTEAGGSVTFNQPADIEAALRDPDLAGRTESLGREAIFCRIECLDDDGHPVADGEVGELVISAPSVFDRYLNRDEETAQVLRDRRVFTGDLAYKDADGFVYMAGRKREMIKSGGLNVYPAEVEMVLTSHPDVIEAAVIGVADATWGEMVVAFVTAKPGCDAAVLKAYCTERLAGYKRPKVFTFVDALPKGETGKIQKRALHDIPLGDSTPSPGR